ncbi:MAG: DUF2080 family transposase-associated protein [archaeon]
MEKRELEILKNFKDYLDEMGVDEIIRGEVKPFGTSAHVNITRKHIGKKTITLIIRK